MGSSAQFPAINDEGHVPISAVKGERKDFDYRILETVMSQSDRWNAITSNTSNVIGSS